jgi:threonine dehydrogenase-like Zn-dependent dehydrogenase
VYPGGELRLDDVGDGGLLPEGWTEVGVRRFQVSVTEAVALTGTVPPAASGLTREEPAQLFGHEFVGTVIAIEGAAWGLERGSRVASLGKIPCLECRECRRAAESRCLRGGLLGIDFPGCFAETVRVPTHGLVVVPDEVDDRAAAGLQPLSSSIGCFAPAAEYVRGSSAAVLGVGPMGLSLISLARHEGARRIFALARRPETRAAAERAGADVVAGTADELEALVAREDPDGVAVVFEAAGAFVGDEPFGAPLVDLGSRIASRGGRVYSVGNVRGRIDFDPANFRAKSLSYAFPEFADRGDLERAAELAAAGVVPIEASHVLHGMETLPEAIDLTLGKSREGVVGAVQVVV